MLTLRLLLLTALALGCRTASAQANDGPRFESAIQQMLRADAENPPEPGAIVFVGSSIFRQWTTVAEAMAPLPVYNRAFGGSRTQDQVDRFHQVVRPLAPRLIVYYCGSNDLKGGVRPDDAFARFAAFSALVREHLPGTELMFVASHRSPDRRERWELVDRFNALAHELCETTPGHHYFDANRLLLDEHDQPRDGFFRDDQLHLHPPAYAAIAAELKPRLQEIWRGIVARGARAEPLVVGDAAR
jgi:lysophospholipase L1-like esterase